MEDITPSRTSREKILGTSRQENKSHLTPENAYGLIERSHIKSLVWMTIGYPEKSLSSNSEF